MRIRALYSIVLGLGRAFLVCRYLQIFADICRCRCKLQSSVEAVDLVSDLGLRHDVMTKLPRSHSSLGVQLDLQMGSMGCRVNRSSVHLSIKSWGDRSLADAALLLQGLSISGRANLEIDV